MHYLWIKNIKKLYLYIINYKNYVIKVQNFGIIEVYVIYKFIMNQCQIKMKFMKYKKNIIKLIIKRNLKNLYYKVEKFIVMLMKKFKINFIKLIRKLKKIN